MPPIDTIKAKTGFGKERETASGVRLAVQWENSIPKFKLRKEINAQGQIYLPKDVRTFDNRSDIEKGDALSLDIFAPSYSNRLQTERREHRCKYVDVSVISGHRVTIPAEVRHELDLQEGDTIAVHAYWKMSDE